MSTNYLFVYNTLKEKITNGDYPIQSLLPAEPVLEKMFHVSRITIRKAVELLAADGLVQKQRGVGTIVLNYKVTQNLNYITSLTETLTKNGYEVTIPAMSIAVVKADAALAGIFNAKAGTELARLRRTVLASGTPLGLLENYLPYELVAGIEQYENRFVSLYRLLEEKYYITLEMAQDRIFAKNADAAEAARLDIPEGFALVCVKRKCLRYGQCVCYDLLSLRHDMYGFDITLYGRR